MISVSLLSHLHGFVDSYTEPTKFPSDLGANSLFIGAKLATWVLAYGLVNGTLATMQEKLADAVKPHIPERLKKSLTCKVVGNQLASIANLASQAFSISLAYGIVRGVEIGCDRRSSVNTILKSAITASLSPWMVIEGISKGVDALSSFSSTFPWPANPA